VEDFLRRYRPEKSSCTIAHVEPLARQFIPANKNKFLGNPPKVHNHLLWLDDDQYVEGIVTDLPRVVGGVPGEIDGGENDLFGRRQTQRFEEASGISGGSRASDRKSALHPPSRICCTG
jgi:hypothetical protein